MGSKVGGLAFAPGQNVCPESLSALTAAWVDSCPEAPGADGCRLSKQRRL